MVFSFSRIIEFSTLKLSKKLKIELLLFLLNIYLNELTLLLLLFIYITRRTYSNV